jgi:CTP synthase (UTP-ammonia lyase)
MPQTARIALVGDRSPSVQAHARIPRILDALAERDQLVLDAYWIPTEDAEGLGVLAEFDGIWLVPGSPYRSEAGAMAAAGDARSLGIPFLGTCGGFQHALLEFAHDACGLEDVEHAENRPGADDFLIVPLSCSLVGHERGVNVLAGSLAERAIGVERSIERYHCSYGIGQQYLDVLRGRGMRFSGVDDDGEVRIAELADHPFFLLTLFQPELAGDGSVPHPIIRAFAAAAVRQTRGVSHRMNVADWVEREWS